MEEVNKEEKKEISEHEKRIRAITKIYYSNPKIQDIIARFSAGREVIPRYFEGFGKRPDIIVYPSDIMGLVNRGATSFHVSEEIWHDPLKINSDMTREEMDGLRKGWDLLIDVDSPFLDCSRIATQLIIAALEHHGIKNYGIKFSGNKGFHIIIGQRAFPEIFDGMITKNMFPEWPRAISEYIMSWIKEEYNRQAGEIMNAGDVAKRTSLKKEDLKPIQCLQCKKPCQKGNIVTMRCPVCNLEINRKNYKIIKKRLKCLNEKCPGVLEIKNESSYYFCDNCKLSSDKEPEMFEEMRGIVAEKVANLDLVLVAPRHLFRMPYSLHEKTALASIVLNKEEIADFAPKNANAIGAKIREYMPENIPGEAKQLLSAALKWKKEKTDIEEKEEKKRFEERYGRKWEGDEKVKGEFKEIEIKDVRDDMFPPAIKKLLNGVEDGKKRGLFILLTFFKSINFSPEEINNRVREWNKLNKPPLKEGYIKSQIEWHLKQKKKILPPNYNNESFYKDLGLIDAGSMPETKNPIVDIIREIKKRNWKEGRN